MENPGHETTRRRTALAAVAFTLLAALAVLAVPSPVAANNIGNQGCTPGYWKNHSDNWEEYSPNQTIASVFPLPAGLSQYGSLTLLQGLSLQGGKGATGGAEILLRAGIAAFLNAAHEGVGYPYRRYADPGDIGPKITQALASMDKDQMVALAAWLDAANKLGCPLN